MNQAVFKKQRGGAAVEMVILLVVMVPLFTALPLLGKISDINNTTIQSSRYLAWERTVSSDSHKTPLAVTTEINNRFFVQPDFHIKTNQETLSEESDQNVLWTGHGEGEGASNKRLVTSGEGMYVASSDWTSSSQAPGLVGSLSSGLKGFSDVFSMISGQKMGLEWKGLVTATVGQDIASNKLLPSDKDCNDQANESVFSCVRRSNTILVDSWNAQDRVVAGKRAGALVPSGGLQPVGDALGTVGSVLPIFHDLSYLKADSNGGFGYVHKNMVPLDRYVGN